MSTGLYSAPVAIQVVTLKPRCASVVRSLDSRLPMGIGAPHGGSKPNFAISRLPSGSPGTTRAMKSFSHSALGGTFDQCAVCLLFGTEEQSAVAVPVAHARGAASRTEQLVADRREGRVELGRCRKLDRHGQTIKSVLGSGSVSQTGGVCATCFSRSLGRGLPISRPPRFRQRCTVG